MKTPIQKIAINEETYRQAFYRFEYLFALSVASDSYKKFQRYLVPVGSYAWESYLLELNSIETDFVTKLTDREIEKFGKEWQPFKAGIYGESLEDFLQLKKNADEKIIEARSRYFH